MILNCPLVSVGSYLFLCVSPAIDCQPAHGVPRLSPYDCWDRLQLSYVFFFFNGEFLSCYSNFLPHPKDVCVRLTGDFKLT